MRLSDSARDRLSRVQALARIAPGHVEGALAVARAALDAREFAAARSALEPLAAEPTQRVAMLMAELEELEGDAGRAREWMARALNAARDPAWTADGIVSERWLPVSPVTGRLDAFQWKVPVAELGDRGPPDDRGAALRALSPPLGQCEAPEAVEIRLASAGLWRAGPCCHGRPRRVRRRSGCRWRRFPTTPARIPGARSRNSRADRRRPRSGAGNGFVSFSGDDGRVRERAGRLHAYPRA